MEVGGKMNSYASRGVDVDAPSRRNTVVVSVGEKSAGAATARKRDSDSSRNFALLRPSRPPLRGLGLLDAAAFCAAISCCRSLS